MGLDRMEYLQPSEKEYKDNHQFLSSREMKSPDCIDGKTKDCNVQNNIREFVPKDEFCEEQTLML